MNFMGWRFLILNIFKLKLRAPEPKKEEDF